MEKIIVKPIKATVIEIDMFNDCRRTMYEEIPFMVIPNKGDRISHPCVEHNRDSSVTKLSRDYDKDGNVMDVRITINMG